jgi:hypothetical protein
MGTGFEHGEAFPDAEELMAMGSQVSEERECQKLISIFAVWLRHLHDQPRDHRPEDCDPMPDLFNPLFSPTLLARRLTGFAPTLSPDLTAIADQWARTAADPAFLNLNEKPLQGQFLTDIFAHLLGFDPAVGHLEACPIPR